MLDIKFIRDNQEFIREGAKKKHIDFDIFTFGKAYILHKSVADVICQNSDTNWLVVKRTIDPVLFEMNDA